MQPTETEGLDKFFSCALKWRTDPEGSQGDSVCKVSGEGLYWRKYLNRIKTRTPIVSFMAGGIENTGKLKGSTYWGNKSIYFHSTVCNRFMELTDSFFAKGLKDKTIGKKIYIYINEVVHLPELTLSETLSTDYWPSISGQFMSLTGASLQQMMCWQCGESQFQF